MLLFLIKPESRDKAPGVQTPMDVDQPSAVPTFTARCVHRSLIDFRIESYPLAWFVGIRFRAIVL